MKGVRAAVNESDLSFTESYLVTDEMSLKILPVLMITLTADKDYKILSPAL